MTIATIKSLLDACYQAKRVRELLPALPPTWKKGGIYGICARGGLLVAAEWDDGKLARFEVESEYGGDCEIRYGDKSWKYTFLPGGSTAEVV